MASAVGLMTKTKSVSEPQNLEVLQEYRSSYVPNELERHLEFLDFNTEGHLLMGCSNLSGRYWVGSVWYYRDPDDATSVEKALTGLDCDNGVSEGFFLGNDGKKVLIALDNGSLELLNLSFSAEDPEKQFHFLERSHTIQEHDDIITGMCVNADSTKIVTSSYDMSLVVLDGNSLGLDQRRTKAHTGLVNHVGCNHLNSNIIASVGNDGKVLTWDIRDLKNESSCLREDSSIWPTCVAWTPGSEHHLVVGNQNGSILVFDTRKSDQPVLADTSLNKQIYRIKFSPKRPNLFAVSSDNFVLQVFDLEKEYSTIAVKYCDKRHDDFIRGLAWHPTSDVLHTCGWDHQVFCHSF